MLRVQLKSEPIIICCSINIPRYLAEQLKLNCANLGPGKSNRIEYHPKSWELQKVMDYVKEAPTSLFRFDCLVDGKEAEGNFAQTIQDYNKTHPNQRIDIGDLVKAVKSIDLKDRHFVGAKISQKTSKPTRYDNGVFYEWRMPLSVLFQDVAAVDESIPGGKNPIKKDALYIKLFVPDDVTRGDYHYYDDPDEVQIASVHRNSDTRFFGNNKAKEDARRTKLGNDKYWDEQNQKKQAGKEYFQNRSKAYDRKLAKQALEQAGRDYGDPELVDDRFSIDDE